MFPERRGTRNIAAILVLASALPRGGPAEAVPKDDWSKAIAAFQAALGTGKDADVEQAASKVTGDNSPRAVEFLLKHVRTAQPGAYWAIISGLSKITDDVSSVRSPEPRSSGKPSPVRPR